MTSKAKHQKNDEIKIRNNLSLNHSDQVWVMTCFINSGFARHFAYRGWADLLTPSTKFKVYPHKLIHVAKSTNSSILFFNTRSTMAKERSTNKDAADSKREKHSKSKKDKEKRSEKDGVHKSSKSNGSSIKKIKSEKIKTAAAAAAAAEDSKEDEEVTSQLLDTLNGEGKKPSDSSIIASAIAKEKEKEKDTEENGSGSVKVKTKPTPPLLGAFVPFAHPLADEKVQKKVYKIVKRGLFCSYPVPFVLYQTKSPNSRSLISTIFHYHI